MPSTKPPTGRALFGERRGNPGTDSKGVKRIFLVITEGKNEYHYINGLKGMIGPTVGVLCLGQG